MNIVIYIGYFLNGIFDKHQLSPECYVLKGSCQLNVSNHKHNNVI